MERLMTVDEVAEYSRLNREVVLRKARKGELPAINVGTRTYGFYREQIDESLKSKSVVKGGEMEANVGIVRNLEFPSYPLGAKGYLGRGDSPQLSQNHRCGRK